MRLRDLIAKLELQIIDADHLSECRELVTLFDALQDVVDPNDISHVARATELLQNYTAPTLTWRIGCHGLQLEKNYEQEK